MDLSELYAVSRECVTIMILLCTVVQAVSCKVVQLTWHRFTNPLLKLYEEHQYVFKRRAISAL